MRVLLVTWPWASHLFPMVPLAWACQAAGHDVVAASGPQIRQAICGAGLTAVTVGLDTDLVGQTRSARLAPWHRQERWPRNWPVHLDQLSAAQRELFAELGRKQCDTAAAMLDDLVGFAKSWRPDVVVHDAVSMAGPVVAATTGVPAVRHMWGSAAPLRIELSDLVGEPIPEFAALFARFGAAPRPDPAVWLDPCPPAMALPTAEHRVGVRYVPYNGPGAIPEWTWHPPTWPLVCVTWGLTASQVHGESAVDLLRKALAAVAGLGVDVVAAVGRVEQELLGTVPERVRVVESLPLSLLLPRCSAVVHLGGAGTTMTAAVAGVPQLAITMRPEQMLTGDRLEAAGVGRHVAFRDLALAEEPGRIIAEHVERLLEEESYRERAAALRAEIAGLPTPADRVAVLAEIAAGARP